MRKVFTSMLAARAAGEPAAPRRRQLIAWSRPMDEQGDAKECGIIRVEGRSATMSTFMFVPNGEMHTESGDVIRVELQDLAANFISDQAATLDGRTLTGSRWRVPAYDYYLFIAWNPADVEEPNQEGEAIVTDRSFTTVEDRWPVTISYWSK